MRGERRHIRIKSSRCLEALMAHDPSAGGRTNHRSQEFLSLIRKALAARVKTRLLANCRTRLWPVLEGVEVHLVALRTCENERAPTFCTHSLPPPLPPPQPMRPCPSSEWNSVSEKNSAVWRGVGGLGQELMLGVSPLTLHFIPYLR